jgi:Ca2+-binding EF-hand superfamily protein
MKRTIVVSMLVASVAFAFAASVARADKGKHGDRPPCTDPIPADKQAKLLEKFGDKGIDANKDGTLTCEEVKAFFKANPDLRPHRGGRGGPGGPPPCTDPIPADRQAKLLEKFGDKGIDANKDGKLTCDEVQAFFKANPDLRPHRRGDRPPCTDPIPADKQAKLLEKFGDKGIDANKDGKLTCDEVQAFFKANPDLRPHHPGDRPPCTDPIPAEKQAKLLEKFGDKGIDANKDGKLTCEEVQAFFKANPGEKKAAWGGKGHMGRDKGSKASCDKAKPAAPPAKDGETAPQKPKTE